MRNRILGAIAGIIIAVGLMAAPAAADGDNIVGYFANAGFSGRPCTQIVNYGYGYSSGTEYLYADFARYGGDPQCQSFPYYSTVDTAWWLQLNWAVCYAGTNVCGGVQSANVLLPFDYHDHRTFYTPTESAPPGFYLKANIILWRETAPNLYGYGSPGSSIYWTAANIRTIF